MQAPPRPSPRGGSSYLLCFRRFDVAPSPWGRLGWGSYVGWCAPPATQNPLLHLIIYTLRCNVVSMVSLLDAEMIQKVLFLFRALPYASACGGGYSRERVLGYPPPPTAAPAQWQAEKEQNQKAAFGGKKSPAVRRNKKSCCGNLTSIFIMVVRKYAKWNGVALW